MPEYADGPWVWLGALLAGGVLGVAFFGGLWWTVRRGAASANPVRWFVGSLFVRTAAVLAGFYAVGDGQPVRMGLCLLGFVLARAAVVRATRPTPAAMEPPCA